MDVSEGPQILCNVKDSEFRVYPPYFWTNGVLLIFKEILKHKY